MHSVRHSVRWFMDACAFAGRTRNYIGYLWRMCVCAVYKQKYKIYTYIYMYRIYTFPKPTRKTHYDCEVRSTVTRRRLGPWCASHVKYKLKTGPPPVAAAASRQCAAAAAKLIATLSKYGCARARCKHVVSILHHVLTHAQLQIVGRQTAAPSSSSSSSSDIARGAAAAPALDERVKPRRVVAVFGPKTLSCRIYTRTCPIGSGLQNGHCLVVSAHFPHSPHTSPTPTQTHHPTNSSSQSGGRTLSSQSLASDNHVAFIAGHLHRRHTQFGLTMFEPYASTTIAIYRVSCNRPFLFGYVNISTTQYQYNNIRWISYKPHNTPPKQK